MWTCRFSLGPWVAPARMVTVVLGGGSMAPECICPNQYEELGPPRALQKALGIRAERGLRTSGGKGGRPSWPLPAVDGPRSWKEGGAGTTGGWEVMAADIQALGLHSWSRIREGGGRWGDSYSTDNYSSIPTDPDVRTWSNGRKSWRQQVPNGKMCYWRPSKPSRHPCLETITRSCHISLHSKPQTA